VVIDFVVEQFRRVGSRVGRIRRHEFTAEPSDPIPAAETAV
jgi:hypothetical protein